MLNLFTMNPALPSHLFFCFLPEILLVVLVCFLILVAVSHHESRIKSYFSFSLNNFLVVVAYFFLFLGIYFTAVAELYSADLNTVTVFMFYNTLKINITLIYIKLIISLLVAFSLYNAKRYLLLTNLVSYEYPLLVSLATLGMFLSLSANNWIVLFLSLELQALCFLVLFAWNRRNVKAITASLKFAIVNFIASLLILLAIVEIVLHTQTFNMYLANPFCFLKQTYSYLAHDNLLNNYFIEWLHTQGNLMMQSYFNINTQFLHEALHLYYEDNCTPQHTTTTSIAVLFAFVVDNSNINYSLLWNFVSFLFIIGFSIKLGLVPFGLWLQDLYNSVSLPVLTFFATAPKITYITILMSLYMNLFAFVNPVHFLYMMGVLSTISIVVSNVAMFSIRNNLLGLFAWSSIANMSLLFFLFSQYPFQSYSFIFILYYTVGTLLFFVVLQYIVLEDSNNKTRHILHFSDLGVLRHHKAYAAVCLVLVSLLNFFGIPPLMGFWMKLAVVQGLVLSSASFINWFLVVSVLLITLVGGYNYLRIFYVLLSETNNPNVEVVYLPATKNNFEAYVLWFIVSQIFFVGYYEILNDTFNSILLFCGDIVELGVGSSTVLLFSGVVGCPEGANKTTKSVDDVVLNCIARYINGPSSMLKPFITPDLFKGTILYTVQITSIRPSYVELLRAALYQLPNSSNVRFDNLNPGKKPGTNCQVTFHILMKST